jgi:hypothetical protein
MFIASQIALIAFACIVPFYMYAFKRFYDIVNTEKPEWLNIRGSLSFLAISHSGDPNVQFELLCIAFGSKPAELQAPMALIYASRIRILLSVGLPLFVIGIAGMLASAP